MLVADGLVGLAGPSWEGTARLERRTYVPNYFNVTRETQSEGTRREALDAVTEW